MRVLSVLGTRPEAVKMAPVIARLKATDGVTSQVCVTAQHRQMLDQVLQLFHIEPDFDLDLMKPDQSLPDLTAAVATGLAPVVREANPDWILIQGDTTTVMVAALLGYYQGVRVGHVEAGLRTGDKWQPFPEEINRRMASVLADLHFAPTVTARSNLLQEGFPAERIIVTGNPVIDALVQIREQVRDHVPGVIKELPRDRKLILVTAHRRESFGAPLEAIFRAVARLARDYSGEIEIVYPVHLNPSVRGPAHDLLGDIDNIHLIEPVDYLTMVALMQRAYMILTDSGGIQEEAPALGVPVLVLREKTERPEALRAGTARLVGTDKDVILREATRLIANPEAYREMAKARNPFGDGHAAERIVSALLRAD